MTEWSERTLIARLALSRALRRAERNLARFAARLTETARRGPARLTIVPQDLRTADPTMAADIYAGHFVFAGHSVSTEGESPFDVLPPSRAWAEALTGLGWLRHLRAADTALSRANARTLVDDFIRGRRERDAVAAQPPVMARRMIALLCHAGMIAEGADHGFYGRFVRHLGQTTRQLMLESRHALIETDRLSAAIGAAYGVLCLDRFEGMTKAVTRRLARELDWQILPDGGHVGRNPRILVDLLLDLLPLRSLYAAKGMEPPRELSGAIDRMMPQIRMFRHGDGALALFNGMGTTQPEQLATLLAYDDARAQPMTEARYSGYARMEAGSALVIADVGHVVDIWSSGQACAGPLAFEFSSGRQRLVVNCGAPRSASPEIERAARSTPAHSTLTLNDDSVAHFVGIGGEQLLLGGPKVVSCRREVEATGSVVIEGAHDGYVGRYGVTHERLLRLSGDGRELTGRDRLSGALRGGEDLPGVLRFHLHPTVTIAPMEGGMAALMSTPAQEIWIFEAGGMPVVVEESVFFAGPDGTRRTSQIVVAFDVRETREALWRFRRSERPSRKPAEAGSGDAQLL